MKKFSRSGLVPVVLTYAILGSGCRTAEFKSVPKHRNPVTAGVSEFDVIVGNTKPGEDPVPVQVPPPDPIVVTEVRPTSEELAAPRDTITEKFLQESSRNLADILVVIDDSNSMSQEQKNLSTKMGALIKSLDGVDWQIGVITTSAKKNNSEYECNLTLIKSSEDKASEKFAKAVTPGINGNGNELGILQAVVGLGCKKTPWVREKSTVAVLIVSDEDNCSNGAGCEGKDYQSETYLTNYVRDGMGRTPGLTAGFYGIYHPPKEDCPTAFARAHIYERLIQDPDKNSKNFGNICAADYQSTLERISKNIATLLKKTFELKSVPLPGTMKVAGKKADGSAITAADYDLMGKVIGFKVGNEPSANSEITVTYEIVKPR